MKMGFRFQGESASVREGLVFIEEMGFFFFFFGATVGIFQGVFIQKWEIEFWEFEI